jgi:hypothetical protein
MAEDTSNKKVANASDAEPAESVDGKKPGEAKEIGGRKGPDPTRFGDWEKDGRCIDF